MKRVSSLLLLLVLSVSFFVIPAKVVKAAIPTTINYQGRLKDAANAPLSGQYDFRFRLYDDVLKTTLLWGPEEYLNETVNDGYFDFGLGSVVTFDSAGLDFTDRYWLTLEIKENAAGVWDTETDPPVSFNAYAYALNAEKVDSLTGLVNVGSTIQGGAALLGAETALLINTGAGFTGDLLSLSNDGINHLRVDSTGEAFFSGTINLMELVANGTDAVGLKAPAALAAGLLFVLPDTYGTDGQVLKTDGLGNLSWTTVSAGGVVSSLDLTVATPDGSFSSGGFVGYQAANDICNGEYPGSHFCRTDEIVEYIANNSTAAFAGTAWIAEGPPGYTSNSNDCNGWTVNLPTSLGAFWEFVPAGGGMGWLTNCGVAKPVACCQ